MNNYMIITIQLKFIICASRQWWKFRVSICTYLEFGLVCSWFWLCYYQNWIYDFSFHFSWLAAIYECCCIFFLHLRADFIIFLSPFLNIYFEVEYVRFMSRIKLVKPFGGFFWKNICILDSWCKYSGN